MNTIKRTLILILLFTCVNGKAQTTSVNYFILNDSNFTIGSIMVLPDIYFHGCRINDSDQYKKLDTIINFLQIHPNLTVEISCHTDIRPIPMTNDTLSKYRADDIVNYMISKGISPNRLIAVGHGSNHPRCLEKDYNILYKGFNFIFHKGECITQEFISNLTDRNKKEVAHGLNRHTEMKILKIE